jgi:hypothetical protein
MESRKKVISNGRHLHFKFSLGDHTYAILKKIYIDFFCNKFTKFYNAFCLTFHAFLWLIQIHFMVNNFTVDLVARYICTMVLSFTVSHYNTVELNVKNH